MTKYLLTALSAAFALSACETTSESASTNTDTSSPVVSITSHPATTTTQSAPVELLLEGSASDDVAIDKLTVSISGSSAINLSLVAGNYSEKLELTRDDNEIVVTATDAAGNESTATVKVNFIATGEFDTSFAASKGYTFSDYKGDHDQGVDAAIASDGSIFVAGWGKKTDTARTADFLLWKYKADGSIDTSFATGGYAVLDDPGASASKADGDYASGLAIDNEGKILIVGKAKNDVDYDLAIARYDASTGALDATFGKDINPADGTPDGFTVLDHSGSGSVESVGATVVDKSGNIYVVGSSDDNILVWQIYLCGSVGYHFWL